jgi:hypothetical protein
MNETEYRAYLKQLWERVGVVPDPDNGIYKYWVRCRMGGRALGVPAQPAEVFYDDFAVRDLTCGTTIRYNLSTNEVDEHAVPLDRRATA